MSFNLKFEKKILLLSIILSVLIIIYILGIIFSPASIRRREAETQLFPILNKDRISEIKISDPEDSVTLKKTDNAWTILIGGIYFPASDSRIEALLKHLISLKRNKVLSVNPDTWKDFDVAGDTGQRILLFDKSENKIVDLVVGKAGLGGKGRYVRIEGTEEVIQVDKFFYSYLNTDKKYWSHLKLFPSDFEGRDFISITVRSHISLNEDNAASSPLDYTLVMREGGENLAWKVEGRENMVLSNKKVDRMANSLANFEGIEFAAGISEQAAGFFSPSAVILFTTVDDRTYRLLIGNRAPEADQFYVKLEGQTYSYLAAEWRIKEIIKPLEELLEDLENE